MDVGGTDQESSLFQAFVVPSVNVENKNVNKTNDPIKPTKPGTLPEQEVPKAGSDKENQLKSSEIKFERFEQFSTLPIGLSKYVAQDLIGSPLEDIDPFYKDKQTFIVVNRSKTLFRFPSVKSLWLFRPNIVIRQKACGILTDPFWAAFMILVVLLNCFISLIIPGSPLLDIPWELIFLSIFILEFAIKVIARGFVLEKFTYLRDPWNCFDLFIIIHATVAMCMNPEKAIYECPTLCELRVLKICSLSLALRRTINIYWQSLLKMRSLFLYILFAMAVISVMCLQMYMGTLSQRCVKVPRDGRWHKWSDFTGNSANFIYEGGMHRACGNSSGAQECPTNYVCLQVNNLNPNYNITSFDTFAGSFFVVFRLIQRDFWEETMQYLTATAGPWHIILFIVLIYYVSFQLCALLWTSVALAYNHLKEEQWERDLLNDLNETQQQQQSIADSAKKQVKNPGCLAKFQGFVFKIIYNPFAVLFIILCILLNTLFMALDHHEMSEELSDVLTVGNYIFVVVFVIEAILKLTALGPAQYFRDEWNTFDFIVTVVGVIELSMENVQGLSVLRAFRLLRPLRLGKIVPAFELLLRRVRYLFSVLRNQTIVLCMFIYIFVVFGCRTFGKSYVDNVHLFYDHEVPRWNFTDIFHSFMVVFRSLCGEWVESFYDCMVATDAPSIVYFCALALIGSFAIMHLFVALILTNDDSSVLASNAPDSNSHSKQSTIKSSSNRKFNLHTFLKEKLLEPNIQKIYDANKPIKNDMESLPVDAPPSTTITLSSNKPNDKNRSEDSKKPTVVQADVVEKNETGASVVVVAPAATKDGDEDDATINKWSKIRVVALKFNESTYVEYIVLAIIFIGSIALVHTVNSFSLTPAGTSFVVELAFCIVMIIEFLSKTISCGWKSYFKNIWCLIDLFNTIVPIVALCTPSYGAANQTILILKALRPLSIVSRCSGLKMIAITISHQVRMLFNSLLVCAAFWLIFAIMGVQMFAGKFYECVANNQTRLDIDFVATRNACETKQYEWTNGPVNFDNVIEAYLSLLQVASAKGWIRLIEDAVDSRDVYTQPLKDSNIYMFNYFVIFIVLGVFVCANLIIGILVRQILQRGNLSDLFSSSNKTTNAGVSHSNASNNAEPAGNTSSKLAMLARNPYFDWVAFTICVFYMLALALDQYALDEVYANILQYIYLVCAILFIIETALRLHSLRRIFLMSFWNFFDAVTVTLVLIELFTLEFVCSNVIVSIVLLRVIRVLRFNSLLVSCSPQLKLGVAALNRSKTAAYNLCLFLFLVIFVYALIGASAFNRVSNLTPINEKISFHTVGQAIILLIQISTSAGWDRVYDVLVAKNHYNAFVIFLYLWSFLYICIMIIVNLVLTIILNYYTIAYEVESASKKLRTDDINDFNEKWSAIATVEEPLFIHKTQLPILLNRLDKSSSLRTSVMPTDENLQLLGIPIRNEQQHYRGEVLIALNQALRRMQSISDKTHCNK
ncbi:sodium channel protein para-like [Sitodiplosis mosellana]|uniref:sodium channel protein para-like n=1 Tax=Sitodiplosis mosellana TaxID=263140 RepID=UPI002443A4FB|nr:sodium channel protein para-like [Sitodiplosis mosellana]XP_055311842.1 sodium channel protein para-like [Sitodiplosis mosellana]XP_055311843.1 sodium channel protein para-like [Sitodiplosis mosellana]XP_055311844.1 sodium channel protein para-like [Sitodiplosis mosellana]